MSHPVGLIGVGLVGSVIADRLSESGHDVIGFDPGEPRSTQAQFADAAGSVCQQCQIVFLSLPHSGIVKSVLREVQPALTADHLIIDTTTGDPEDALSHESMLAPKGTAFVEATIAGSSDLLRKREAGIFLGGKEAAIKRAQALFDILTTRCFHLGDIGAASRFKLVFNLVLGLHRAVLAEALHFGEALGFDPSTILDLLQQSPASSGVMATKGQKMIDASYQPPQARLTQHLKDVRLMLAEAERAGIQLPLTASHRALLESAESLGYGAHDTSAVIEAYRQTGSSRD